MLKKVRDHLEEKGVKNGQRSPRAEMCRVIAMGRDVETGSGCFGGGGGGGIFKRTTVAFSRDVRVK